MRRFDERVGFLKSVPLMKDLNEEFLSKIADVLKEVDRDRILARASVVKIVKNYDYR